MQDSVIEQALQTVREGSALILFLAAVCRQPVEHQELQASMVPPSASLFSVNQQSEIRNQTLRFRPISHNITLPKSSIAKLLGSGTAV